MNSVKPGSMTPLNFTFHLIFTPSSLFKPLLPITKVKPVELRLYSRLVGTFSQRLNPESTFQIRSLHPSVQQTISTIKFSIHIKYCESFLFLSDPVSESVCRYIYPKVSLLRKETNDFFYGDKFYGDLDLILNIFYYFK